MADAAMHGGRWVINLEGKPDEWDRLMSAQRFFNAHRAWGEGEAIAVVGILSDFAGANEFPAGELLNLTARQHQPYRILTRSAPWPAGLKSIIYADAEPPDAATRAKLEAFVKSGGLLITGDLSDPYEAARDAQVRLSHRNDLVRFWNGGSLGSYLTRTPKGAMLQIINYAGRPGADPVSVRVAGPYREARIHLLENDTPKPLPSVPPNHGAIELHLPAIPVYAAIELT
jgi:hypothetical protein